MEMTGEREPGEQWKASAKQAWTLLVLAGVFAGLTVDALVRDRGSFDYRLLREIQRLDFPWLEPTLRFVSDLTGSFWAITLWSLLLLAFLILRRWLESVSMLVFPVAGGLNSIMREVVGRSRPEQGPLDPNLSTDTLARLAAENDYVSYPSGHVVGAVLLWGMVFLVAGEVRNAVVRSAVRAGCLSVIVLAGISRTWCGAHWVSDVVAGYAFGGLFLFGVVAAYRTLGPTAKGVPLIHAAPVPHDDSHQHAHALTSTILFRGDEVTKIYNPGFVPRLFYWLSFQAAFAYQYNPVALRAAVLRRNLAGKLTEYWFGTSCVSESLRVDNIDGRWGITSRFTDGAEPQDHDKARAFLFDLTKRFDEAGLPTWQVDPRQPRSLGNALETPDGTFKIIDLESGMVSPLASPRAWWHACRRALVPIYDDVYFDLTRQYVDREAAVISATRGNAWLAELRSLLDEAEEMATRWHASEPRLWSRTLRLALDGFGFGALLRRARRVRAAGSEKAEAWLDDSIVAWLSDGRITAADEASLRESIRDPEFQSVLPHMGVHLIIGVALRFPFGSITRAAYTTGNLALACILFGLRRIDGPTFHRSRRIHSPLVILISAMPAIGTFSYLASGPVRSNHLLARVVFDTAGVKLPLRIYERLGIRRLVAGKATSVGARNG